MKFIPTSDSNAELALPNVVRTPLSKKLGITAGMVLAFRTRGPLPQLVLLASTFLGGVYYPTTVIPGWIKSISAFLPLTYGLEALRAVLLEGKSVATVWRDVSILLAFTVISLVASIVAFKAALRYARRVGNLAQY